MEKNTFHIEIPETGAIVSFLENEIKHALRPANNILSFCLKLIKEPNNAIPACGYYAIPFLKDRLEIVTEEKRHHYQHILNLIYFIDLIQKK